MDWGRIRTNVTPNELKNKEQPQNKELHLPQKVLQKEKRFRVNNQLLQKHRNEKPKLIKSSIIC